MAGLSSADIFSILEEEIGKNDQDQDKQSNDPKHDGEIILQNSANPGTILQTGSDPSPIPDDSPNVIAHDFTRPINDAPSNQDATARSSYRSEFAATGTDDVQGHTPSPEREKESRGAKMKKTLRIRQVGQQITVRVFVDDEELCGMALTKEAGNSISLGGVSLFIDGDETVLEV